MLKHFRTYLLKGLLIILPAGATFLLFFELHDLLHNLVLKYISQIFIWLGLPSSGILNFLTFIALILVIGYVGGNFIGRQFISLINLIINKIPYIRVVHGTIQQILETIFAGKKSAFSRVALVEYPRKGVYSLGFITAETQGALRAAMEQDTWSIFIPTTPNPTSGVLIFVPKDEVKMLDLTADQAAKLIMSAGVIDDNQSKVKSEPVFVEKIPSWFQKLKK